MYADDGRTLTARAPGADRPTGSMRIAKQRMPSRLGVAQAGSTRTYSVLGDVDRRSGAGTDPANVLPCTTTTATSEAATNASERRTRRVEITRPSETTAAPLQAPTPRGLRTVSWRTVAGFEPLRRSPIGAVRS